MKAGSTKQTKSMNSDGYKQDSQFQLFSGNKHNA